VETDDDVKRRAHIRIAAFADLCRKRHTFEVRHDEHCARFRPITCAEWFAIVEYHKALLGAPVGGADGRPPPSPRPSMPFGVAAAPNDVWVSAVNEDGDPIHSGCTKCLELGGAAVAASLEDDLARQVQSTRPEALADLIAYIDRINPNSII
jgi:hypothetical protein